MFTINIFDSYVLHLIELLEPATEIQLVLYCHDPANLQKHGDAFLANHRKKIE